MFRLHNYLLPSILQTQNCRSFLGASVPLPRIAEPIIHLPPSHERDTHSTNFDVLLTVHLSIILAIDQLDAQNLVKIVF